MGPQWKGKVGRLQNNAAMESFRCLSTIFFVLHTLYFNQWALLLYTWSCLIDFDLKKAEKLL